jgi:hypothetical protein
LGEVLTTPHHKNWPCYKTDTRATGQDRSLGATYVMQKHVTFDTWNIGTCIGQVRRIGGTKGAWYEQAIVFVLWKKKRKSLIGNGIFCSPQNIISS